MSNSAFALLELLKQPDNPQFETALAALGKALQPPPAPTEAAALLAALDQTIATLQGQQATVATQLGQLRQNLSAFKAYGAK